MASNGEAPLLVAAGSAIIYKRTGPNGECYIGRACSPERFDARQGEHDRATNRANVYETLDENVSSDQARVKEEQRIRENGGPSNQGGTLENKRYEMNQNGYENAGGTTPKPTAPSPKVAPPRLRTPGIRLPGVLMIPGLIFDFIEFQKMMSENPCAPAFCV